MIRSPREILKSHVAALSRHDVSAILRDYEEEAVVVAPAGVIQGRSAIEDFYTRTMAGVSDLEVSEISTVYADQALLLVWTGTSPGGNIDDGVDTFVFADGRIKMQTTHFTVSGQQVPPAVGEQAGTCSLSGRRIDVSEIRLAAKGDHRWNCLPVTRLAPRTSRTASW